MSYNHPSTGPELISAISHRRPFDISARAKGRSICVEGHYIAVLSHHLDRFELSGTLAGDVVRSAKDLYERYVEEQPAIASFPMTRDAHPVRIVDGAPEQEPNPGGGEPDRRALHSDEAVYYVTATTADGTSTVLGYVTAGGAARIDSAALALLTSGRADAIAAGLQEAADRVRERTSADPHFFDGAVVERKA